MQVIKYAVKLIQNTVIPSLAALPPSIHTPRHVSTMNKSLSKTPGLPSDRSIQGA
jgi:hypothetical protein